MCPEDFYEYKGFSGSFHPISLSKEVARSIIIILSVSGRPANIDLPVAGRVPISISISCLLYTSSLDNQGTYGHAVKDSGVEGLDMVVTGPDGEALDLPLVDGKRKGIGMHSYCSVTYDIAGKGYSRFESWVGANHLKEYANSMIFKVYFDNETEPRYTSPEMSYLVPVSYTHLDVYKRQAIFT